MKRSLSIVLGATLLASTLAISNDAALAQPADAIRSVESLQRDFAQAGFQTGASVTWWTNRVTTFTARDGGDRLVMVLVYPSNEAAQAERLQAAAHDGDGNMDNPHPHLVPGYGPSEFRGNVALVETSYTTLSRLYDDDYDFGPSGRADGARDVDAGRAGVDRARVAATVVDTDLLAIVNQGVVVDL